MALPRIHGYFQFTHSLPELDPRIGHTGYGSRAGNGPERHWQSCLTSIVLAGRVAPRQMETPGREVEVRRTLCCRINRRDLNPWSDVLLGVHVPNRNLEVEVPVRGMKGEAITHRLVYNNLMGAGKLMRPSPELVLAT